MNCSLMLTGIHLCVNIGCQISSACFRHHASKAMAQQSKKDGILQNIFSFGFTIFLTNNIDALEVFWVNSPRFSLEQDWL